MNFCAICGRPDKIADLQPYGDTELLLCLACSNACDEANERGLWTDQEIVERMRLVRLAERRVEVPA